MATMAEQLAEGRRKRKEAEEAADNASMAAIDAKSRNKGKSGMAIKPKSVPQPKPTPKKADSAPQGTAADGSPSVGSAVSAIGRHRRALAAALAD